MGILSSDDRYTVGTNYSKYANQGNKILVGTYKYALERVHGFDYVPENLRSLSFIQAARHLNKVENTEVISNGSKLDGKTCGMIY